MNARLAGDLLRSQLIDSLFFESDAAFRARMGQLVKRTLLVVGILGPLALVIFVAGQVLLLGKVPVLSYEFDDPRGVTVLLDKLAMLVVFILLLAVRSFIPDDRPVYARAALVIASVVVVAVITLDDVAIGNVRFSPAYVTMVLLFLAAATPMRPLSLLATTGLLIGTWFVVVEVLPQSFGFPQAQANSEHIVFLVLIAVIATGASSLLYGVRFEEYRARKTAEDLSAELTLTNKALEDAIADLRRTQTQLVYAEKMASLGRFATGVAHEMRNPLNFVTNFSRLSVELLDESKSDEEVHEGDVLRSNLKRILEHAVRAEQIVKSLIAHAKQPSSASIPVDLNQLVSEQARIVSQRHEVQNDGSRPRVELVLDSDVGSIRAFPAELALAVNNVLDNAFRAVLDRLTAGSDEYEPEVIVTTERNLDGVRLTIRDNGVGMSEADAGKVFEPFYTTRPTGSGTGLGLSMAYAVITEEHGGTISVESTKGDGTIFTITLRDVISNGPSASKE
jgi:signal transduction histidine kinase